MLPKKSNLLNESEGKKFCLKLIQLEQKYLDLFSDKYNINPLAGKTRLGSKHSEANIELLSKLRKQNPSFLNKTHDKKVVEELEYV